MCITIFESQCSSASDHNLFFAYGDLGRVDDATNVMLRDGHQTELDDWDRMVLAYCGGDREKAAHIYKAQLRLRRPPASEGDIGEARDAAYGGDLDYAFEGLTAAADMKTTNLIRMMRSKLPEELYSDPRWVEFWNHPNMKPLFELYLEAGDVPWIPIMNAAIADRESNTASQGP